MHPASDQPALKSYEHANFVEIGVFLCSTRRRVGDLCFSSLFCIVVKALPKEYFDYCIDLKCEQYKKQRIDAVYSNVVERIMYFDVDSKRALCS